MGSEAETNHQGTTIRVGVAVPNAEASARGMRARLDVFCQALATAVKTAVEPHGFAHYRELLDGMHEGRVDLAWLPPVIALRATARGRTLPIALPVRAGAYTFSSALFTRPGSPLKTPADLIAVRAGWVDRDSAAGYLVIRAALRARGIDLDKAFASEKFFGSHGAVVQAVLAGEVDVGATFAQLDARQDKVEAAGWGASDAQVIAYGGPIPADVVAASIRMEVPLIRSVQRALCDPDDRDLKDAAAKLFGAEGFVVAESEHLAPLNHLLGYLEDVRNQSSIPPPMR
jgi:phosphonate transport system substrate-binding protein